MGTIPRVLPIQMVEPPVPASSLVKGAHEHGDEGQGERSLGQPAPCMLHVEDTAISEADIAREMQFHRAMRPEQSRADAARALVVRELLRREVQRLHLADGVGDGRCIDEERQIQRLLEQRLGDRAPTEADCRRYFDQNPERFHSPDRIQVRHILLAAPADDVAGRFTARAEADRLIAQLRECPHLFADLASRFSRCPSNTDGGALGWLVRGQTTPEFDRQVFRLRPGLAGFPVESRWGYHVVSVDAVQAGERLPYEEVRGRISDYLELQARQCDVQRLLRELQDRYQVRGLAEIEALAG